MAKEQVLPFIIRINDDKALQSKLEAVTQDGVEGIVKIGRETGFDFTADEFRTVAFEQWEANRITEIPEDELDTIAGGQNSTPGSPVASGTSVISYNTLRGSISGAISPVGGNVKKF